jgi:iron complex transport system substrate-binding protein
VKNRISDIVPTVVTKRLLAALVLVVLALPACGERPEPVGEVEQPYPVTVQGAGERPTVAPRRPERIVVLDPGSAELLVALGARDRIVGAPAGVPRGDGAERVPREAAEVVSSALQVDVDEIVRLEPDLIVATGGADLLDISRAERRTGAALYVQPSTSVEDVLRGTLELGFLVGEPVRARQLASRIRSEVAAVEDRVAGAPSKSAFIDTGFFITVPERSLLGDLVRRAHGESVAGQTPGLEPFPLRRLSRLNPDVYLATSDSRVALADLRKNPRTAALRAVKRGRFAVVPSRLVHRAGPRVGLALEHVARALHPDVFDESR